MIVVRKDRGDARLEGALEPGTAAYLDGEWVHAADGCDLPVVTVSEAGTDPDAAAFAAFAEFAAHAVEAVAGVDPAAVEVVGRGVIALEVRRLLRQADGAPRLDQPAAVVETTGEPQAVVEATRRLKSGGVLVLAGQALGRRLDLNLYPDIHVRALRIVGAGSIAADARARAVSPAIAPELVPLGESLRPAAWFRVRT